VQRQVPLGPAQPLEAATTEVSSRIEPRTSKLKVAVGQMTDVTLHWLGGTLWRRDSVGITATCHNVTAARVSPEKTVKLGAGGV
jgi:hypothetical protein